MLPFNSKMMRLSVDYPFDSSNLTVPKKNNNVPFKFQFNRNTNVTFTMCPICQHTIQAINDNRSKNKLLETKIPHLALQTTNYAHRLQFTTLCMSKAPSSKYRSNQKF